MKLDYALIAASVVLAIVLFITIGSLGCGGGFPDAQIFKGLPLPYEISGGFTGATEYNAPFLIIDIIFWFLVAVLLVWSARFVLDRIGSTSKKKR